MKDAVAIVLAAGLGTRMNSGIPKVLHELLGKPMISHLLESIKEAGIDDIITVAGYGSDLLEAAVKGFGEVVIQKAQLGSGHAVNTAAKALGKYSGDILVFYGDTPLIKSETIKRLVEKHKACSAGLTLLTTKLKDPRGYGRIVRDDDGKVLKIVEEVEASLYEEVIEEVNVGVYCFDSGDLFQALEEIKPDNKKKEYFLTDTIGILYKNKKLIESVSTEGADEVIGVNSRLDLAEASSLLKKRILRRIMAGGVTIEDPASTTIYPDVKIGKDTVIYPNTVIESDVEIGKNSAIGPFARLRGGVRLGDGVEVGNFVELVRTKIGDRTKVKHHTYLGDAEVGKDVNIGAGTITANYDGKNKNKTVISDHSFIGVGAILIAPVKIGKKSLVGAGCVVPKNHDVPDGATVVGVPAKILKKRK